MNRESPTVVAIAVVQQEGKFLVGIRPKGVPLAGFAEFPGGKVHAGETPAAAAVRECREETGLEIEVREKLLCTTYQYDHGLLEIHFFACKPLDFSQTPKPPFLWAPKSDLDQMKFPAANDPLTKLLQKTGDFTW